MEIYGITLDNIGNDIYIYGEFHKCDGLMVICWWLYNDLSLFDGLLMFIWWFPWPRGYPEIDSL